jgi:putative membrane protein
VINLIFYLVLIFLGIGIGIVAGLIPGLHVNTTIPLILSLSFFFQSPYQIVVLIISVAITEIFIDYIPSIFLGAPEADTSLSVLPGHRLLLEGRGREAIKLTIIGGLGCLILSLILITLLAPYFQFFYTTTRPYIQYLLILVILFMIISEKKPKKIAFAFFIIVITGLMGLIVLNSPVANQQNILFPTLTGLFGMSTIIISISEKSKIPKQHEDSRLLISPKEIIKAMFLGSVAGIIVGFLPAIGISEAGTMVQYLGGMGDSRGFLVTISGINAANDAFSIISLYLLGNPRSGTSIAIGQILGDLTLFDITFLIGIILFTAGIASLISLYLSKIIPKHLERINYKTLSFLIISLLIFMVFLFSGIFGLLVLFTSTSIGILCAHMEIRRSHCMGLLLVPTLFFFLGITPLFLSLVGI